MLWYVFVLLCFNVLVNIFLLMVPEVERPNAGPKNWTLVLFTFLYGLAAYFVGLTLFSVGG